MKRSKVSILGGALLAGALAVSIASPAAAEFTPQPKDVVGTGSDTTQVSLNYLADGTRVGPTLFAGYNATASARLVSFDAVPAGTITLKVGTTPITRPHNTGTGRALLYPETGNSAANFARASSSLSAADIAADLVQVPFAVDGIQTVRRAAGSNAPANLTRAQLVDIYRGAVNNWSQVGGQSGTIVPLLPFDGSGTRTTFIAELAAEAGVTPEEFVTQLASTVVLVQEHDPAPIAADANAIAPFSTGRAASAPTVSLISGWSFTRALYNVVREADLDAPWFGAAFGPSGFICSGAATPLIEAAGFLQLMGPDDDGVCGVAGTTAPSAAQLALTN